MGVCKATVACKATTHNRDRHSVNELLEVTLSYVIAVVLFLPQDDRRTDEERDMLWQDLKASQNLCQLEAWFGQVFLRDLKTKWCPAAAAPRVKPRFAHASAGFQEECAQVKTQVECL